MFSTVFSNLVKTQSLELNLPDINRSNGNMLIQDNNKIMKTDNSNEVIWRDKTPAGLSQKLSCSALSIQKDTNQKISDEFEKRHFKVGKFKLCFPFSNGSSDLSIKINSMAKDSKGSYS